MKTSNFLNYINHISDIYQQKIDQTYRKDNGIFYTHIDLARKIIFDLFDDEKVKDIHKKTFLEPAVGSGIFVFAYLEHIAKNYTLKKEEIIELYNNIYACDSDEESLNHYAENLLKSSHELFGISLPVDFRPNIGRALLFDFRLKSTTYLTPSNYFKIKKFDFIVTNPPYKNLRAERRHYKSTTDFEKTSFFYSEIKKIAKSNFVHSGSGNANIFRYFTEEILLNYAKPNSKIALLIPSSILTDKSSLLLRKYMIENANLKKIVSFPESTKYVDANQSVTYLILDKHGETKHIEIAKATKDADIHNLRIIKINAHEMINEESSYSIFMLDEEGYQALLKLKSFPKLKELGFVNNLRGELDLTLNKSAITSTKTKYILLKGRNIGYYQLNYSTDLEFVNNNFVEESPKKRHIAKTRLACQQIVNLNKEQRLMFAIIPPMHVLGNSCNFISVEENVFDVDIYYLQGLLNSRLMNWYFKLYSSNNHVNNYELADLPIPVADKEIMKKISKLAKLNNDNHGNSITEEIDKLVEICFGIKEDQSHIDARQDFNMLTSQINELALKATKEKQELMQSNKILNDFKYRLSDLDMEIIKSVPQGGNWKDIPQDTMNKSKRLLGIQKTGGRTTLYGRLSYDKPSYTITTYFNRPGNGCNIHPTHNRVLSTREAARLQGFPDDFYFVGNQRDILKQIGNAIPPQIGYLIGERIKRVLGVSKSIDLFSGTGGLLLGMKHAGIQHVLATDFDKSACITLKTNNPEINVVFGDITNQSIKDEIIFQGISQGVDIICGGPPCQGFSMAGFRNLEDPRNKLIYEFVEIINAIKPKVFVFENVIGILSHNKGKTFADIKALFSEKGYELTAETLNFEEYGVPQRRKRVIIIGVREDLGLDPKELLPVKVTHKCENQITVREAIADLDKNDSNQINHSNLYLDLMRSNITFEEYSLHLKNFNT